MSSKKKDPFSEAIVGLFMLAVFALLVYFTIIISGVDILQGRQKVVANVVFTDVGGLKDHDSVMYRGTKVGTVEAITLSPTNLTVAIEIDRDVILRQTCKISVCNLSMLGGNYLLLEEGAGEIQPLETTLFKGEDPTDWMRDVSNIAKNLNEFTSGGELKAIVTNIEAASVKVLQVVDRIERGEGTIGKLLSTDDSVYQDLRQAVGGANTAISNINVVVERIERGEGTIGKLVSDEEFYGELRQTVGGANTTISNVNAIVERVERGEGSLGKLLSSDETIYNGICETVDEAKSAVSNANAIVARVERGEGTLGKLLSSDETIYNGICETVDAAKSAVSNANAIVARVERGEGTVGKLLSSDDTLYNDLQRTVSSAADIVERLHRGEGLAGRLLAEGDPLGAEVDASLAAFKSACESFDARGVISSAETLLANLNLVAERLRDGEGSLGKLINDPTLYNEVEGLSKDVRQTLDNFRDTTPISTFGSLITGGL